MVFRYLRSHIVYILTHLKTFLDRTTDMIRRLCEIMFQEYQSNPLEASFLQVRLRKYSILICLKYCSQIAADNK